MRTAKYWITHLKLHTHPEGGFYRETYRSKESLLQESLPDSFNGPRNFSTAIYFLLRSEDRSLFHRIQSDELWHFHDGSALTIYVLDNGRVVEMKLGSDPAKGESLQVVIPANRWFGAKVNLLESFTLAGCTVAPGFDFQDFELANREDLLMEYPDHSDVIKLLTPGE